MEIIAGGGASNKRPHLGLSRPSLWLLRRGNLSRDAPRTTGRGRRRSGWRRATGRTWGFLLTAMHSQGKDVSQEVA